MRTATNVVSAGEAVRRTGLTHLLADGEAVDLAGLVAEVDSSAETLPTVEVVDQGVF